MIKLDEINEAIHFVSDGESYDNKAYLEKSTGKLYFYNGFEQHPEDEDLPKDIDSNNYILIPSLKELDLKQTLIFNFALNFVPEYYDEIRDIFRRRKAYRNYRELLIRIDALDKWYDFENKSTKEKIIEWCVDNDVKYLD